VLLNVRNFGKGHGAHTFYNHYDTDTRPCLATSPPPHRVSTLSCQLTLKVSKGALDNKGISHTDLILKLCCGGVEGWGEKCEDTDTKPSLLYASSISYNRTNVVARVDTCIRTYVISSTFKHVTHTHASTHTLSPHPTHPAREPTKANV